MSEATIFAIPQALRVVVTAGAQGIGRAIAETFHAHGARVHICDVSAEAVDACRTALPEISAAVADVADVSQVDDFFAAALADLGGLDVLVNNAGIAGPTAGVEAIEPADWERTVAVNLNGQFYCARRAVPALRESAHGAMINISSVAGRLGFAYRTPYAATKWAVVGFTQSLAKELGPDGIRVNAILPGVVEGERIEQVIAARAETLGKSYAEVERDNLSKVSLRRMVSPYDVANMALFLCSPAGQNISGQALSVCGNVETI
ncbi:MAG: SDR family oxidoreductase [Gammaproteobacteria bacterium]|nr:SDR family oxidoreductase [Gammaproteobacteria bacterium]